MNRIFLCFSFLIFSFAASSQKVYFIYLQSESGQPFYVKLNERIHSSSASGYLILSKLLDSTYNFTIGFPANKWPEHNFIVSVNRKDQGFLLKDFGEKGWGLFNLQSLGVQMPVAGPPETRSSVNTDNKDVSVFTKVLSKAADDPAIKEKPVIQPKTEEKKLEPSIAEVEKKEEPKIEKTETTPAKPAEEAPVAKKEQGLQIIKDTVETRKESEIIVQPVVQKEAPAVEIKEQVQKAPEENKAEPVVYKRSVVKRKSESSTTEGFGLVFIDESDDGNADTIRLLIPNPKTALTAPKEEPKEEKKFLEISVSDSTDKAIEARPVTEEKVTAEKIKKNNCPGVADESDFFKVRKRMAAEDNEDNMVGEAKKYFKTKCFTTLQLKNLGSLFLSDESRYKFFDMAYFYVSDIENFFSLESELKDPYYINRFKAMLR
ncbi:MAG: DUF4476 domain-containing protein [Bacteroidota bacterium]